MKEQFKKYTQKFNAGLITLAGIVIANPELANFIPSEYWRYLAAGAIIISATLGKMKQSGVSRGT